MRKYGAVCVLAMVSALAASVAPRFRALVIGLLLAGGMAIAVADLGGFMGARYPARSICDVVLPLAMFLWLWSRRRPLSLPPPTAARDFAVVAIGLMAAAVTVDNLKFALAWRAYDRAVVAAAYCGGPSCGPGAVMSLPPEAARSPAAWGWSAPFHAVVRSAEVSKARLVTDSSPALSNHQPLACADARRLTWRGERPPVLRSLAMWACAESLRP
jgi:hypothetical protein